MPTPPIERLSHDKAKAALLAVAARPQRVLVPNDVDRLLGEGEIVDMFAFAVNVSAEDPTNTTPFVRTLLGYLAHLHYEAGRASMGPARFFDLATALRDVFVRMEAAVAHDATMTGVGNVQRSWEALKAEMLRQEQINAPVRSEGQRWDEGECDPIRDIRTAMEMPRTVDIEQVNP